MENNNKIRELYSIYLELGHEVFEEKIKKPMELYLHANSNVISMNSLNTIIANAMEKSKLGEASFNENDLFSSLALEDSYSIAYDDTKPLIYDDYNDEYDIFSPPTIEEKINYDYNMPPIFDDYGDENNNDSYFVEFAPTTINKNDYVYVGSINSFMHVAHDKNVLCDSYIVNFIHDATESYYERGKHGFMYLNNIKFPLFMLKILKLHLFCFPMLVALCFHDLFLYKIPMHRKWVRLKCVLNLLLDALFYFNSYFLCEHHRNYHAYLNGYKERAFWETTQFVFAFSLFLFL